MATIPTTASPETRVAFDPVRGLWRLLTSVRFALGLIAFLALASLLGVLIPQLPSQMRGNAAAEAAWLEFQRRRFGFLTDTMDGLGLFEIFRSLWFATGLAALVVSVCVCTANRLGPVWRNVSRPQTRVPDDYFERGQPVIVVEVANTGHLTAQLRRRRFRVSMMAEGATTYLFADRYPWAQLATFISHLALVLFIAGGLVTVMTSKQEQIFTGEGATTPVFRTTDSDHLQVYVEDAVGEFDATGFPRDFRTSLVVFKGGREIARGVTTVNRPLKAGGFKFHQSAYFADGAELRVRDVSTGRVVYDEVLALESRATAPRVVVRDAAGNTLLEDAIVPTDFLQDVAGTVVVVPGTPRAFWIGSRGLAGTGAWQLIVFETGRPEGARDVLAQGDKADLGGLSLTFLGMTPVPSTVVNDLPGAEGGAVIELSDGPAGKVLTVGPVAGRALVLGLDSAAVAGGYEYSFVGQREFAGITVRRDPGSTFIWVATGLLLLGLGLTFYTPRRRLWGRIVAGEAVFRGLGGRPSAIEREVREAAKRAPPTSSTIAEVR